MAYNRKLLYTKSFPSWNTPEGNLGNVVVDVAITPIQLVATEINEPGSTITYAVTTGSLPTGLTLSSSGEISGTPTGYTSNETVNFTVTATDDEGETAFRNFSFQVVLEYEIEYLIIAGGGAGGTGNGGSGGGGAGGYLSGQFVTGIGSLYTFVVGAGGAGGLTVRDTVGDSGDNSTAFGITAIGGGGGGAWNGKPGLSGGSGGGAGQWGSGSVVGGAGTPGQGNKGGDSATNSNPYSGGGGGGAGEAGEGQTGAVSNGGDGLASSITGSSIYRAGGGGAGTETSNHLNTGLGGLGGGGNGGTNTRLATSGSTNTGSGGGGGGWPESQYPNGSGGSGVVILRMPTASYSGTITGSPTVTTDGSDTILTYTGSGTYTS